MKKKTALSWSSGKDSAWALHTLSEDPTVELSEFVTTLNLTHNRVAMHAVRRELLERQAAAAGLPLRILPIPHPCSNEEYQAVMQGYIEDAAARGIEQMAFGDLFLEDIRAYREKNLAGTGIAPIFPLWEKPTRDLAEEMIEGGLRATLTCVDPRALPARFAGRAFDHTLIKDLPDSVDPCGENGEFHSFVHAGPFFTAPLEVEPGEIVERDGFVFADLLPASGGISR